MCTAEGFCQGTHIPNTRCAAPFVLEQRTKEDVCAIMDRWEITLEESVTCETDDTPNCDLGYVPDHVQQSALARLNLYRELTGLNDVVLDSSFFLEQQRCAVIQASVNEALTSGTTATHFPETSPNVGECFKRVEGKSCFRNSMCEDHQVCFEKKCVHFEGPLIDQAGAYTTQEILDGIFPEGSKESSLRSPARVAEGISSTVDRWIYDDSKTIGLLLLL
jgi:hypothetical protein